MKATVFTRTIATRLAAMALFTIFGVGASTAAQAEIFNGTPTRTIGPFVSGQSNPVPGGGWMASDDRLIGASINGQAGWSVACSPAKYDEEISHTKARTGLQSWRVSNWFHEGCVNSVLSPAFASVAEGTPPTNGVVASYWFNVPSSNTGLLVSSSLGDATGMRMTYAAIRDDGALTVQAVGILQGSGYGGAPMPAPFDDPGVEYSVMSSPSLSHDTWYQLRVTANLQIGARNDQVTYEVLDSANLVVWSSGSMPSWEDGYLAGPFAAPGTKVTVTRLGFRIVENPDNFSNRNPNATYALNRPIGMYIDDLSVVPGAGQQLNAGFEADRYVAPTGTDAGTCGTATPAASRCKTIAYALSQATPYNTIHVANGTYDEAALTINKAGLQLVGEGATKPIITVTSGGTAQRLVVVNNARDVRINNLDFHVDKSYAGAGILAMGDVDGLVIDGNHFVSSKTVAASTTFRLTNAIAVNYSAESGIPAIAPYYGAVDGSNVIITNNVIDASATSAFRSGIQMDRGVGTISGNTIYSGTQDLAISFPTIGGPSAVTSVQVDHNTFNGRGVQISSPNAGVTGIVFNNNIVRAVMGFVGGADAYGNAAVPPNPADFSLMRIIHNVNGVPLTLSNNQFLDHAGGYRGVLIENFPNVTLTGNTFTPKSGASDFASLVVSNKEITSDNPASAPVAFGLTAKGNIFNGSGSSLTGRAVEFINDNDADGAATAGTIAFGGSGVGEANQFDGNHRWYFRLDDHTCDLAGSTDCGLLNYPAVATIPNTKVRPFRFDVGAEYNNFAGVAPAAMSPSQKLALGSHTYDKSANPALGIVNYGFMATQITVYVDDDYATPAHAYGDPLTFMSAAAGTQTVYFGINAFATIPDGLMHVQADGIVYVAKGVYPSAVLVDKHVQIIGDGETALDTVVTNTVAISGSGISHADPLLLQNLRVANIGSYGIDISSSVSHIAIQNVTVTAAATSALNFGGAVIDDVVLDHYTATANIGNGLRTGSSVQVSNVVIVDSVFSENAAGIVLFGAAGSGTGQLTHWAISNTQFLRNDNANTNGFGAGLWLKTAGPGSVISDFSVTGSTFSDNGSSVALNKVGITVRARPGTTMTGINICNNTFSETATLGTQLTGINVFDDTGNSGYSPITVCSSNTFSGLVHSISGEEQNTLRHTQPIVNITGGTIADTFQINGYVVRQGDGATFTTISAALADPLTLDNETILVPAGSQYNENVVITQNHLTLQGGGISTIVDGTGKSGNGITVAANAKDVIVTGLWVRSFSGHCLFADGGTDGLHVEASKFSACGDSGVYMNVDGQVDGVTITGNEVTNVGTVTGIGARGIVLWDDFKKNITITNNNVHDISSCCGIELQDGTASGVTVTGNTVTNTGDSGMAFIGLTSGAGPNLIQNNTVSNNGRFGIEIKLPNGTGSNIPTEDGAIIVSGNTVTLSGAPANGRDIAGIAVARRGYLVGNADIPTGVVVRNNSVSGWMQSSANDGFGIVVEGTQMHVFGNILSNNDVDIQRQAGNDGYPGDSDQAATNAYFSRGNSPQTCAAVDVTPTDVDTRANPTSMEPIARNAATGRIYCTLQSAIDDPLTVDGHSIEIYDGEVVAEQVLVNKSVRLTTQSGPSNKATIKAPATTNGDLALMRVSAPNVEIDNLIFNVDLSKVGEAIRTVGNLAPNNPSGISIHNNAIVATSTGSGFVSYSRRNALSLNMSGSYALAGENIANLVVSIANNNIDGTQDWDTGTSGNQPAFFRSAIGMDVGSGTISGNTLRGRDYDAFIRFTDSAPLTINGGNNFNGGGLYLGDGNLLVTVQGNNFVPDRSLSPFAPAAFKWGDLGFSAVRLVNASHIAMGSNTFSDHTNAIFAQNVGDFSLTGNTFNAPAHGSQFRHLIISSKVLSSGSDTVAQVPLAINATSNIFHGGSGATPATAVELVNHDNDNAQYGMFQFGGASVGTASNTFDGNFTYYFRLDPTTGTSTAAPEPYQTAYGYAGYPATSIAPFGNTNPIQAVDNTFASVYPNGMSAAQISDLQSKTYHNDPLAPETMPTAPASLGRVEFGFASSSIATTTTVVSATPVHGVVGTPVMVTVAVVTNAPFNGTPTGTVTVTGIPDSGATCTINYPASTSCSLGAFASSGLKMISAEFTDGVAADSTSLPVNYQVFTSGGGGTTTVTACTLPACTATATDNDYTRINNAVQVLQSNNTLTLNGSFDWTEAFAAASWAKGSDGIAGNDDDYAIEPPRNLSSVTITAAVAGGGPLGATIQGPGDLAAVNLEGVFSMYGGSFKNWTISKLVINDFDLAIGMFYNGAPIDGYDGVKVLDNTIQIAVDLNTSVAPTDLSQNIGLHYAFGKNQEIAHNVFIVPATGVSNGTDTSTSVVMQSNTSGAGAYDGLHIHDNLVQVTGVVGANPPKIFGFWENDQDFGTPANLLIENNSFLNQTGSPAPVGNLWRAFVLTSQSVGTKQVIYRNNTVQGASLGFTTILGSYTPGGGSTATQIIGNTLIDNLVAIRADSDNGNAKIDAHFNRIVFTSPGTGVGVERNNATIDATNNWWGCQDGPNTTGCTTTTANPAQPTTSPWLKLSISAATASIPANNSTTSAITTQLVQNTDSAVPSDITAFPSAKYLYTASIGTLTPSDDTQTGGLAHSSFKSATAGGAQVTTTLDNGSASTFVLVTNTVGPPNTVSVTSCTTSGCTPSTIDNDYTRINNAVQASTTGTTIILDGTFNWSEPNAAASWMKGSNGVLGIGGLFDGDDDYAIILPAGVNNVTVKANTLGAGTVIGNEGATPSDLAVFIGTGSTNTGWKFQNLTVQGFDIAFGMSGSGVGSVDGTIFMGNHIDMPADSGDDYGNYGIYTGYGQNQTIAGNTIAIDITGADGTSPGARSRSSGIVTDGSCNNQCADGLAVSGNTITVTGTPMATPPSVLGIWENQGDSNSSVTIDNNTFTGSGASFGPVGSNGQTALAVTTQSNGSKLSKVSGNTITGAAIGLGGQIAQYGFYIVSDSPLLVEGNTFLNNGDAMHLPAAYPSAAKYTIRFNRIFGNAAGLVAEPADAIPAPGAPGYGGTEVASQIDASNNWWGCNYGPGQSGTDCPIAANGTTGLTGAEYTPWLTMSLASDTPVVGAGGLALLTASVNRNSAGDDVSGTTVFPKTSIAFASNTSATFATPTAFTGDGMVGSRGKARDTLNNIQTTTIATSTLDGQLANTTINVNQVVLHATIPPAAAQGITTTPFPVTISNGGAALSETTKVFFNVSTPGIVGADVSLEFENPVGTWNPITLAATAANTLGGSMPVGLIGANANITVNARATFNKAPTTFNIFAVLVGDTTNSLYSSDGGDVVVSDPATIKIELLSGSPQTAPISSAYAAPLVAKVTDAGGNPLSNIAVSFTTAVGGANVTFASASGNTDANGLFTSGTITANTTAGVVAMAQVAITSPCTTPINCSAAASLTNTAASPASITVSPTSGTALVNTVGAYTLTATVLDASSNPVSGVSVSFTAPSSGASVAPASVSVLTNASGQAVQMFDANSVAGSFDASAMIATSGGPVSAIANLTNTAGVFDHLTIISGSGQTAPVNAPFAAGLVVRAEDSSNNPVSGVTVTFVAPLSGASAALGTTSFVTLANGLASTTATANGTAGGYMVSASSGVPTVNFSLTNTATAPASVVLNLVGTASANVNTAFAANLCAIVKDSSMNPLAGVSVTFAGPGSGASATFMSNPVLTDAAGQACTTPSANSVAGSYVVTALVAGSPAAISSNAVSLTNTDPATAIVISAPSLTQTYNGSPRPVSVTTTPAGLSYSVSYTGIGATVYPTNPTAPTNAGSYSVVATITQAGYAGSTSATLTIAKAVSAVTFSGATNVTYDGNPHSLTAVLAQESGNAAACTVSYTPGGTAPTNTGTYTVAATCDGTNYTGSASTTLTISNASVVITISNTSQVYDGSPKPVTVTTTPSGLTTSVTYNGGGTVPTNAGTYNVVATITSPGYSGTQSATLIIDKAVAGVAIGNLTHVYNGLAKNATATTTPPGIPVTFTYNGSATSPINAGSYTVVATASNGNYAGTATATLTISKAVATVNLSGLAQIYNGTPRIASVSTAPSGLATTLTYDGSPTAPTPVGSYTVVATVVDANYQGSNSGTLVVSKATATVTVGNLAQAYTGSPISASATTSPSGLTVNLTYNGSPTPPTAVGSYTVQATVVDANYSGTGSGTLVISQSTATVTLSNLTQVYNGAPRAVTATTDPLGLPRTITYDGSPTPPSAVGTYAVVATITDPSYTGSASGTLTITKATATVTISNLSQIYDGSPRPVTVVTTPSGLSVNVTYDGSPTAPTNTGTYAVVATVSDTTYQGSASGTLVVTNGNATIALSNLSQTYDGTPRIATATTTPSGLTVELRYDGSLTAPTNAGTYTVSATITSAGYSGAGAGTLVVNKAVASVVIGNLTHVYNGLAKNATATTTPSGIPVTFTYNGSATQPINAGSYTVVATASNGNYTGTATDILTIAKAVATVTLSDLAQTYNGAPRIASATTTPSGLATTLTYDGSPTAPTPVGSYTVVATVVDANYQGASTGTLVVSKATATVTLGNLVQTYTGSPISASATTAPSGLTVSLTYDGNPTPPTAVGSYTVQATVVDANYSGTGSGTLVIGQATATVTLSSLTQEYNGAPRAVVITTSPSGLPHTVTYDGSLTPPSAVGTYAVVATITDPSYTGSASGTLTITKATATVMVSNLSQIYDGGPRPVTVVTTPSGLSVNVTYDGSPTAPTNTGTYAVVATVSDTTYQGSASGTLVVTNGNATIALSNLSQTYDGTPRIATATTTPSGLAVELRYDGSLTAPTNAGTYTVSATITSAGYSGAGAGTLVVGKATAMVTLGNLSQSYDGTPRTVTATTSPSGLVVDFSYAGSPTAPVNAGTYVVTGTVNDANYQGSATANLVVTKATATVVLGGLAQTYTGAPRTVTATTTPSGLATSISYDASITAPVDAGSYAIVATITDANYQGTASVTLVVAKATATVTLSNLAQSFDGTPRPVTITTAPAGLTTGVTYAGSSTVPSAVGSYAVVATIISGNYEGSGTGTLVVSDGTAAITLTGLSYTYDGTPKSASATTNPTGLNVAFTYDGNATPPTNAGSYAVVATITSSGYTGTASGTLIISKASASVTLGGLNPTYDGFAKSATATTTPSGLGVAFTYDGSATAPINAGTYLVVGTITDPNYSGSATATMTIAKAAATIALGGLNQQYDGTPRSVSVTTGPVLGLATAVTYDGSATAPTNVGTYAVSATITDPNYIGSQVGTLVITSGNAGTIAANGATTFSGTVAQPIAGALPSVLVTDAGGNPVANVPVTFTASANSGSLSGAIRNTGSNGVATLGGWVLGPTAPTQTVTATATGVPGSVLFTATAGGNVVLSVTVDSGRQYVRDGTSISHLVSIGNSGSLLATGVTVTSTIPPELDSANLQWICVASAGSSCGSSNSGTGNLPTTINIAAGGNVSFVLTGTVLRGPTDFLTYTVAATRPSGTTGSDGSDTHTTTIVIFRNGFEEGSDGAQGIGGDLDLAEVSLESSRLAVLAIDDAIVAAGRISTLAGGAGGSFRIEATWLDGQVWLRLVTRVAAGEVSSGWNAIDRLVSQIGISYEPNLAGGPRLMVFAGAVEIDQPVEALRSLSLIAPARNAGNQH